MAAQDETKTDLTRIDQLPTLEHEDDPAIDQLFAEQAAAEDAGKFSALEDETPAEVLAEETQEDLAAEGALSSEDEPPDFFAPADQTDNDSAPDNSNQESSLADAWADDPATNEVNEASEAPAIEEPPEVSISSATSETPEADPDWVTADAAAAAGPSPENDFADPGMEQNAPTGENAANDDNELDLSPLPDPEVAAETAATMNEEASTHEEANSHEETMETPGPLADENVHYLHPANPPADASTAPDADAAAPDLAVSPTPSPDETIPQYMEFPEIQSAAVNLPPLHHNAADKSSTMQDFAQAVFPANASSAAPAYSLKLEDIDPDQHEAIMAIIREAKIYAPADEKLLAQSLANGKLLITQISEYMAVTLAHQLRRLAGKLVWGLAQDIHPSSSYSPEENRGAVRNSLPGQNTAQSYDVARGGRDLSSIILTTAPQVDGHTIARYLDLITEQAFLRPTQLGPQASDLLKTPEDQALNISEEIASWDIYHSLCARLRQKALAAQADAIVNLNFTLQPVFLESGERGHHLRVTGNLVTFN